MSPRSRTWNYYELTDNHGEYAVRFFGHDAGECVVWEVFQWLQPRDGKVIGVLARGPLHVKNEYKRVDVIWADDDTFVRWHFGTLRDSEVAEYTKHAKAILKEREASE